MFDRHTSISSRPFSDTELAALQTFRSRYLTDSFVFTKRELAHLRFMRWLVHRPEWNRALDQPVTAQEESTISLPSQPWTPGLVG